MKKSELKMREEKKKRGKREGTTKNGEGDREPEDELLEILHSNLFENFSDQKNYYERVRNKSEERKEKNNSKKKKKKKKRKKKELKLQNRTKSIIKTSFQLQTLNFSLFLFRQRRNSI